MIAEAAPDAELSVFDLPHVIEGTARAVEDTRVGAVAGSFFEPIPGPADVIVMKHIIHDWDDESSRKILGNCRDALAENGRIVLFEMLVTDDPRDTFVKLLDIEMLVGPGGRERTEQEFAELFSSAGLKLNQVIRTGEPVCLIEAVKA